MAWPKRSIHFSAVRCCSSVSGGGFAPKISRRCRSRNRWHRADHWVTVSRAASSAKKPSTFSCGIIEEEGANLQDKLGRKDRENKYFSVIQSGAAKFPR